MRKIGELRVTYRRLKIEVHSPRHVLAAARLAEEGAEGERRRGLALLKSTVRVESVLQAVKLHRDEFSKFAGLRARWAAIRKFEGQRTSQHELPT